jgi:hypothetical protein
LVEGRAHESRIKPDKSTDTEKRYRAARHLILHPPDGWAVRAAENGVEKAVGVYQPVSAGGILRLG